MTACLQARAAPNLGAPAFRSIVRLSYGSIELPSCPLPASSRATGTLYLISEICISTTYASATVSHRPRGQDRRRACWPGGQEHLRGSDSQAAEQRQAGRQTPPDAIPSVGADRLLPFFSRDRYFASSFSELKGEAAERA